MRDSDKPFVLLARVKVKEGKVDEYLKAAAEVDAAVEQSEPGMLFHNFDADPTDHRVFTWTEVYQNDAALHAHLNNPPVGKYLEDHAEFGENFEVDIYGLLGEETIQAVNALGIPWRHHKTTHVGYVRDSLHSV